MTLFFRNYTLTEDMRIDDFLDYDNTEAIVVRFDYAWPFGETKKETVLRKFLPA